MPEHLMNTPGEVSSEVVHTPKRLLLHQPYSSSVRNNWIISFLRGKPRISTEVRNTKKPKRETGLVSSTRFLCIGSQTRTEAVHEKLFLLPEAMPEIVQKVESLWRVDFRDCLTDGHGLEIRMLVRTYENFLGKSAPLKDLLFEANAVLDRTWETLNVGKWVDVPEERKQVYAIASFFKIVSLLHENKPDSLQKSLEVTDLGILLGFPFQTLSLTVIADWLSAEIHGRESTTKSDTLSVKRPNVEIADSVKKSKLENELESISCPSLEFFRENYFTKCRPVKLRDCIDHWPALERWRDLGYIVRKAGHRTVPVELGKHYADGSYSQKLMRISDFVTEYFRDGAGEIGYLAQHQLFDQVPELKKDITEPDYCALSENADSSCQTEINAWFGPKGTVSPLHFDPKHNLLCQVVGSKKITLYPQEDAENLYPHEGSLLFNTSRVDVENPDLDAFPNFAKAEKKECLLNPGEMLYIPPKHWHHVRALENSFSVSFWWD